MIVKVLTFTLQEFQRDRGGILPWPGEGNSLPGPGDSQR